MFLIPVDDETLPEAAAMLVRNMLTMYPRLPWDEKSLLENVAMFQAELRTAALAKPTTPTSANTCASAERPKRMDVGYGPGNVLVL